MNQAIISVVLTQVSDTQYDIDINSDLPADVIEKVMREVVAGYDAGNVAVTVLEDEDE